jgi:hypothetical protein
VGRWWGSAQGSGDSLVIHVPEDLDQPRPDDVQDLFSPLLRLALNSALHLGHLLVFPFPMLITRFCVIMTATMTFTLTLSLSLARTLGLGFIISITLLTPAVPPPKPVQTYAHSAQTHIPDPFFFRFFICIDVFVRARQRSFGFGLRIGVERIFYEEDFPRSRFS